MAIVDTPAPPTTAPRRPTWRLWVPLGVSVAVVAVATVLAVLAGTYQPVAVGGAWGGDFPGLANHTQWVNTFGDQPGQAYEPPSSGVFGLEPAIANSGPRTVTIEAVSLYSPQQQASFSDGVTPWPLVQAGPVRWWYDEHWPGQHGPTSGASVAGLALAPGRMVILGIPVRDAGRCYDASGWTSADTFYVEERFGPFTHWVAVPFSPDVILHEPANLTGPNSEPAKDLTCPK